MTRPKKPCSIPGCAALVDSGPCPAHAPRVATAKRLYDESRGSSAARGYDADWKRFRAWFLSLPQNKICHDCKRKPPTDVHHVKEIRDRPDLRLVASNCRALCKSCHRLARERRQADAGVPGPHAPRGEYQVPDHDRAEVPLPAGGASESLRPGPGATAQWSNFRFHKINVLT